MPALSDIVSVSTTVAAATPTTPNTSTPLVMAQNCPANFVGRVMSFTGTAAMVTLGFATNHPAVLAVGSALAQNPACGLIKVGKRALGSTWTVKLTVTDATQGDVYTVTVQNLVTGTKTNITRTVPGSSSNNAEATAIAALINAVTGFAASAGGTNIVTITATGGVGILHRLLNWQINGVRDSRFYLTNTTADPGIATDMAAIVAADNNWYGLTIDNESVAEQTALATWAETNKKLFVTGSAESTVVDSGSSTDIASVVQTAAQTYSAVLYNGNDTMAFAGLAWQSSRFAGSPTPGNDTWSFKTLANVAVDTISETEQGNLATKNATGYSVIAGINCTSAGSVANNNSGGKCGSGMYIDVRRFIDWLNGNIQTGIFQAMVNVPKIPYTDKGGASLGGIISGNLVRGEEAGGLVAGSSQVLVPTVAAQSSTDRGNRKFNNITWNGSLAGAVHLAVVSGTAS